VNKVAQKKSMLSMFFLKVKRFILNARVVIILVKILPLIVFKGNKIFKKGICFSLLNVQ
jgi:hypothetical protein